MNISKGTYRVIRIAIIAMLCSIFSIVCVLSLRFIESNVGTPFGSCWQEATISREPITLQNFEMNWNLTDVYVTASDRANFLVADDKVLVVLGKTKKCANPVQIRYARMTGEVLGNSSLSIFFPHSFGVANTAYNSNHIYMGYDGGGQVTRDSTGTAGGIVAFEIDSGDVVWSRTISGTGTMRSLVASENIISVDGGGMSSRFYTLDATNSEVVNSLMKGVGTNFSSTPATNFAYWYDNIVNPNANSKQNILFWKDRFEAVTQPPLLLPEMLIIKRNHTVTEGPVRSAGRTPGTAVGSIVALDRTTGRTIWETENTVVSNVALDNATAFFITSSAELIALDTNTGNQIGSVQFSGEDIKFGENGGFFVAAGGNSVYAYFGDGRQLFAFSFLTN